MKHTCSTTFNWRQSGAHSDKGTMRQHAEANWAWELLTLKFGSELCSARCPMYSKLMLIQMAYKAKCVTKQASSLLNFRSSRMRRSFLHEYQDGMSSYTVSNHGLVLSMAFFTFSYYFVDTAFDFCLYSHKKSARVWPPIFTVKELSLMLSFLKKSSAKALIPSSKECFC